MTDGNFLAFLSRTHRCEVVVGGEKCELRLLSAQEMLALRRVVASGDFDDAEQRAVWSNGALLSLALQRNGETVFESAEAALAALGVGEINALVERYAKLDGAVNPSAEGGRGEMETLKKV